MKLNNERGSLTFIFELKHLTLASISSRASRLSLLQYTPNQRKNKRGPLFQWLNSKKIEIKTKQSSKDSWHPPKLKIHPWRSSSDPIEGLRILWRLKRLTMERVKKKKKTSHSSLSDNYNTTHFYWICVFVRKLQTCSWTKKKFHLKKKKKK